MLRFFSRAMAKAKDHGQRTVVMVAFGDSVTEGAMQQGVYAYDKVYHFVLQRMLEHFFPATTFSTVNSGYGGDSATRALGRIGRDVIQYDPDLVYVAFGLNDSLEGKAGQETFRASLEKIVHTVREKTKADILMVTPPYMAKEPSFRVHRDHEDVASSIFETQKSGMLGEYAEIVRGIACENKTLLADVHEGWKRLDREGFNTDQWLINGLNHPCGDGHRFGAAVIYNTMMEAYKNSHD